MCVPRCEVERLLTVETNERKRTSGRLVPCQTGGVHRAAVSSTTRFCVSFGFFCVSFVFYSCDPSWGVTDAYMHVVHRASRRTLAARDVKTLHRVKAGGFMRLRLTVECVHGHVPAVCGNTTIAFPRPKLARMLLSRPHGRPLPRSFVRSFICDCSLIKYPVHTIEGVHSFVRSFVRSFTFAQLKASTAVYARFIPYRRRALVAVRQSGAPEMEKLKSKADISP